MGGLNKFIDMGYHTATSIKNYRVQSGNAQAHDVRDLATKNQNKWEPSAYPFIYLVVKNKEGGEGGFKERDGFKKNLPPLEKWGRGGGGLFERCA